MRHSNTKCASFSTTSYEQKCYSLVSLEIGIVVHRPISNGKSMVLGVIGNDDLELWWSQWLLKAQFTSLNKRLFVYLRPIYDEGAIHS